MGFGSGCMNSLIWFASPQEAGLDAACKESLSEFGPGGLNKFETPGINRCTWEENKAH